MGIITGRDEDIEGFLVQAYGCARAGSFEEAESFLEKALSIDFENPEVVSSLKCVNFWKDRDRQLTALSDPFEKGEYLLKEWRAFSHFLKRLEAESRYERCSYSIRQYVFGQALFNYMRLYDESTGSDTEILSRLGKCYKGLGNYGKGVEFFERASHQKTDDPELLAELADCYAFVNETRAAKVFFREAFYINPQKIDICSMESLLIQRLVDRIAEMGYHSPELEEWIPVYGVIFGVFNVKRELRPIEYGQLKQGIYTLESKLAEKMDDPILVPRRLNRYFWLIDHYICGRDTRDRIDEILGKIRELNPSIYELYTH